MTISLRALIEAIAKGAQIHYGGRIDSDVLAARGRTLSGRRF